MPSLSQYFTRSAGGTDTGQLLDRIHARRGGREGPGLAGLTSAGLGEQQVRLAGGRQVGDAVASVEHDGALGEGGVGANLERLVVAVLAVVVVGNVPAAVVVDGLAGAGLDVVADDLHVGDGVFADEVGEQGADDGLHAAAQHNDGDVVGAAPVEEVLELGVELYVGQQRAQALVKGRLHAVEHLLEGVAEGAAALQHVAVALLAQLGAEAEVVRHVVVAVLQRDGAVEIGEEDGLGVGLHSGQVAGGGCGSHGDSGRAE